MKYSAHPNVSVSYIANGDARTAHFLCDVIYILYHYIIIKQHELIFVALEDEDH